VTAWSLARGWDRLVPAAILGTVALLAAGLWLPVMTVDRFFVFASRFSILESLEALWNAGEFFLFAAIALFSVVFPLAKLLGLLALWCAADTRDARMRAQVAWVGHLGRWSMLDVFLVAILLVSIRSASVAGVRTELGLYVFGAAVVASILVAWWTEAALARLAR
jgi:paraquat-inducible protein A